MLSPKPLLPLMLRGFLSLGENPCLFTPCLFTQSSSWFSVQVKWSVTSSLLQVGDGATLPSLLFGHIRCVVQNILQKKKKFTNFYSLTPPPPGLIALPLNCMLNTAGNCSYDYRSVELDFRRFASLSSILFPAIQTILLYRCGFAVQKMEKSQLT